MDIKILAIDKNDPLGMVAVVVAVPELSQLKLCAPRPPPNRITSEATLKVGRLM